MRVRYARRGAAYAPRAQDSRRSCNYGVEVMRHRRPAVSGPSRWHGGARMPARCKALLRDEFADGLVRESAVVADLEFPQVGGALVLLRPLAGEGHAEEPRAVRVEAGDLVELGNGRGLVGRGRRGR